jgi:hypothetical protein
VLKRDVQNLMNIIMSLLQVLQLWSRSQKVGSKYAVQGNYCSLTMGEVREEQEEMGYSVRIVPLTEWVNAFCG